jgi:hypothetical protein
MGLSLIASTIERHELRMKRLQSSIKAMDNGLQIALTLEHSQAFWRSIAMLIGMPAGAAGVLLTGFLFQFWDGMGLWYGVSALALSSFVIKMAADPIETQHLALQKRLLDLVLQRQALNEELAALYEKQERLQRRMPKNPIEVKSAAA